MNRILIASVIALLVLGGVAIYDFSRIGQREASVTTSTLTSTTSFPTITSATDLTSSQTDAGLGRNIRIDNYTDIIGDVHGVEPYVAVGKDGTIHVAWIGLQFQHSTTYIDQNPQFVKGIWYSFSRDGGKSFSSPVKVSLPGGDPSIGLAPNGDVLIAYLQRLSNGNGIFISKKSTSLTSRLSSFEQLTVQTGGEFDRPWIAVDSRGIIYVVWSKGGDCFWSMSQDGHTFSTPSRLGVSLWPTGIAIGGDDTVHLSLVRWGSGGVDQVWFARKAIGASFEVRQIASVQVMSGGFMNRQRTNPWPALATEGQKVFLVYVQNDKSLYLITSDDDGATWSSASQIRSSPGILEMPWMAVKENTLVIAWRENIGGYWNTYFAKYKGTSLTPVRISDQNGYPANVMNWHGDFMGIALLGPDRLVIAWSDGRNLPMNYGYGHIYLAITSLPT